MACWVWRIALAMVMPLVEGQEKRCLTRKFGRHIHFIGINCHMNKTTTKIEERLVNISVFTLLFLAVITSSLVCPRVFKFERYQWNTIDKQHHIYLL